MKLTAWTSDNVDQLETDLIDGPLADVRQQVDQLLIGASRATNPPTTATLLVLEERVASAIQRIGD